MHYNFILSQSNHLFISAKQKVISTSDVWLVKITNLDKYLDLLIIILCTMVHRSSQRSQEISFSFVSLEYNNTLKR